MENSFKSLIEGANSALILLPTNPNFDEVAAGLSLYLALGEKKEVAVHSPSSMIVEFNRLVGVNKVTSDFGNKNLTMHFRDYKAADIERVSYDIENGEFRLTVIPKPGFSSPQKEQIQLSYSGVAADLVILIGGQGTVDFPALSAKDLLGAKILHLGTRALEAAGEANVLSFARVASSVSEVVASLLSEGGYRFDADSATNLLAGIHQGSQNFAGPDVTAETFELVAALMRAGAQRTPKVVTPTPTGFSPEPVYSQGQVQQAQEVESKPARSASDTADAGGEEPPKDWLEEPKVYKGTSVS